MGEEEDELRRKKYKVVQQTRSAFDTQQVCSVIIHILLLNAYTFRFRYILAYEYI